MRKYSFIDSANEILMIPKYVLIFSLEQAFDNPWSLVLFIRGYT